MSWILEALKSRFKKSKVALLTKPPVTPKGVGNSTDIHGRQINDADIFFYPRIIRGIPVFTVDSVITHYRKEIRALENYLPLGVMDRDKHGRKLFDALYKDVIYRFVEYAHLIPASEDHHHSGPGGLLIHSLETAFNALTIAENKKYIKSGLIDIDQNMSVRARYAAWVCGLLHDTGKILRDIIVEAVDVIVDGKQSPANHVAPIPAWAPHLESMIEWATKHKVATYSVRFNRSRKHNQHNVESSHLLPFIIGRDTAMEYLVKAPAANLYSEISNALSGHATESYLSKAVKDGDSISTAKDMDVFYDPLTSVKTKSTRQKMVLCMQTAKTDWKWNTPGGEGWLISGGVYISWPLSIKSMVQTAMRLDIALPYDQVTLVNALQEQKILEWYDNRHRTVKFVKGEFTDEQVTDIADGKTTVAWEELLKVKWDGYVFNDDPRPSNTKGLMYLPDSSEYLVINRKGEVRSVVQGKLINTTDFEAPDNSTAPLVPAAPAGAPIATVEQATTEKPAKKQTKSKSNNENESTAQELNQSAVAVVIEGEFDVADVINAAQDKTPTKGVNFRKSSKKGADATKEQSPNEHHSSADSNDELKALSGSEDNYHATEMTDIYINGSYETEVQGSLSLDEFMSQMPSNELDDNAPGNKTQPTSITENGNLPNALKSLVDSEATFILSATDIYLVLDPAKGIDLERVNSIKRTYADIPMGSTDIAWPIPGTDKVIGTKIKAKFKAALQPFCVQVTSSLAESDSQQNRQKEIEQGKSDEGKPPKSTKQKKPRNKTTQTQPMNPNQKEPEAVQKNEDISGSESKTEIQNGTIAWLLSVCEYTTNDGVHKLQFIEITRSCRKHLSKSVSAEDIYNDLLSSGCTSAVLSNDEKLLYVPFDSLHITLGSLQ